MYDDARNFPVVGWESEWGYITENLLFYIDPVVSEQPQGITRGRPTVAPNSFVVPGIHGSPYGPGWYFGPSGPQAAYGFLLNEFSDMAGVDFTVAVLIRQGMGPIALTNVWIIQVWQAPPLFYKLQMRANTRQIHHIGFTGTTLELLVSPSIVNEWIAIAIVTDLGAPSRTIYAQALDGDFLGSASSSLDYAFLSEQTSGIKLGTDEVHPNKLPDQEVGCFIVVNGAWSEDQFRSWASNPLAWARNIGQKKSLFIPRQGCVHANGEVEIIIDSSVEVGE